MPTVSGVYLNNFRTYTGYHLPLTSSVTLIIGPNAVGKTTLIEAICLLATGDSFRASKIDEMIKFEVEYARVKGAVQREGQQEMVEVLLTRGIVQGKPTQKRLFSLNDVRKRRASVIRQFACVVFRPEDMRLVEGSPARRRQFLDGVLSGLSEEYSRNLSTYEAALKRYNRLLWAVNEGKMPITVLQYWVMELARTGAALQEQRRQFIGFFKSVPFPVEFELHYEPSVISQERILEYQGRAIAAGHALIGAHKDDFSIWFRPAATPSLQPLSSYGSRGQQRLGVLWLKLGELAYIREHTQLPPVLLLDDILSELDITSRHHVLNVISAQQTVITSADPRVLSEVQEVAKELQVIELSETS